MNIEAFVQIVQDLRAQLEVAGINSDKLLLAAGVASVLFILSLRQVLTWYLKVDRLRGDIRALHAQNEAMQKSLADIQAHLGRLELCQTEEVTPTTPKSETPLKRFALDN